jgi:hypothetical protein
MSKYDNLFKNAYNSDNTTKPTFKTNIFLSKDTNTNTNTNTNFKYKEELFPDLIVNKAGSSINKKTNSKNYADIAATVNEVKKIEKNPVMPGWIQYSKSNKKTTFFDVTYGDKTKQQIEQEQRDALLNDSMYIHNKIISTLANNWNKYKRQYDEVHGEGAYDLIYYTEPIYPSLDENLSDDEKESNTYSSEEEYTYYHNYNDYDKY